MALDFQNLPSPPEVWLSSSGLIVLSVTKQFMKSNIHLKLYLTFKYIVEFGDFRPDSLELLPEGESHPLYIPVDGV